ncbi:galactokinase [Micropruina sonneratiae]|uniref:galactokinase n=1 Tax=Micropruina sonneratiae TaxID=2986940 RepID=UPI002227D3C5|nr:galactokinase [Micropruina sp. KQZ13P-5]MCW3157516.1 galactokinase [Micropruina sp. KQZ13P-5]
MRWPTEPATAVCRRPSSTLTDKEFLVNLDLAVLDAYRGLTGTEPEGIWRAPGRINLIGEHTDYNDGFVLPFALPQAAYLAAGRRGDGRIRIVSVDLGETVEYALAELSPGNAGWHSYLAGVFWAMREAGHTVGGADLALASDVPIGAGLSSSAAIECVLVSALNDLYDLGIEPMQRAKLARVTENAYVGAPTGLMDQAASTLCEEGRALFLDCRSLEVEQVPFDPAAHGYAVLVVDTLTRHSHADGEYATRRADCERAAELLGVPALRDVSVEGLDERLEALGDERLVRRARHVVTEDARVLEACTALREDDFRALGELMTASHASMRADYEITEASVDLTVEVALAQGAAGARMTGGGFGGCVLVLAETGQLDAIGTEVTAAFTDSGRKAPPLFVARPAAGAGRLT